MARQTLGELVTVTRNSPGSYRTRSGAIAMAAPDEPRFDAGMGLVVEESRRNLVPYSGTLGQWAATGTQAGAIDTPMGAADAQIVEDANFGTHSASQTFAITQGDMISVSAFVRPTSGDRGLRVSVLDPSGASLGQITLDATGAISVSDGFETVKPIPGAGPWLRVQGRVAASETGTATLVISLINGSDEYQGNGSSGFGIWGIQAEVGDAATSVIPTGATAETRASDDVVMPGVPFWAPSGGTVVGHGVFGCGEGHHYLYTITDGTWRNLIGTRRTNFGIDQIQSLNINDGSSNPILIEYLNGDDHYHGAAFSFATNSFNASVDGLPTGSDEQGTVSEPMTTLSLGSLNGKGHLNGTLHRLVYYPSPLPLSEIQQMI